MHKKHFFLPLLVVVIASWVLFFSVFFFEEPATNVVPELPEYLTANRYATGGQLVSGSLDNLPTPKVHSFNAVAMGNDLFAVWYGGSGEAKEDVAIFSASYTNATFSKPRKILDSARVMQEQGNYNYTLGNPVLWKQDTQHLWLFAVQVPIGGWSSSQLLLMRSQDSGENWSYVKPLVTSPFINISTLVKNHPVKLQNGFLALPAYHELARNHSELLILDASMRLVDKRPIGWANHPLIQPTLLVENTQRVMSLHRSMDSTKPNIYVSKSQDGGNAWQTAFPLSLPNPDASIHALNLQPDLWLMMYNHSTDNRRSMDLAVSTNQGVSWQKIYTLAKRSQGRLGYPWLVTSADGTIHAFYTVDRTSFAHMRFDLAWIQRQQAVVE